MADTYTTNLNLTKPEPGAAEDTWGISLNSDLDTLDAIFSSSGTQVNLNPNQVNFADNKKAIFGTGSDLEIYHDGSNSYVKDVGTGNLWIGGVNVHLGNPTASEYYIQTISNGAVTLYYDNSAKLATTSSGIDVTGTVTADGLTVDGVARAGSGGVVLTGQYSSSYPNPSANGYFQLKTNNQDANRGGITIARSSDSSGTMLDAFRIDYLGDISFYDDTGTSQNLKWDASADSLNFVDNAKAQFGAGNDLQIYHNGSHSNIQDTGTGNLRIAGSTVEIAKNDFTETMAKFVQDGAVELYYNGAKKLETTSTGIDVTGTVTSDGLTVQSSGLIQANMGAKLEIKSTDNFINFDEVVGSLDFISADYNYSAQPIKGQIRTQSVSTTGESAIFISTTETTNLRDRIKIDKNGDISFYDDTGTTQGLFWDASAEYLGIGTTSPSDLLHIADTSANTLVTMRAENSLGYAEFGTQSNYARILQNNTLLYAGSSSATYFYNGGTTAMALTSTGLGIGTSSPSRNLEVHSSTGGNAYISVKRDNATSTELVLGAENGNTVLSSIGAIPMTFYTNGSERVRIDSSGNVGIGTDSPVSNLHIKDSASTILTLESGTTSDGIILFGDADDINIGSITYNHTANYMSFETADSERVRIDSSGNLLVGTTDLNGNPAGICLRSTGLIVGTVASGTVGYFNRTTSDGTILDFRKDGTAVGSIATKYDDLLIYSTATGHKGLRFAGGEILPVSNAGALEDNTTDLGSTNYRFKDAQLSGKVNVPKTRLTNNNTTYWDLRRDASTGDFVISDDGLGDVVTILQSSGNVGIGTDSPTSYADTTLHVSGSTGSTLKLSSDNSGNTNTDGFDITHSGATAFINNRENGDMVFRTNNTEALRVDSSQRVGIGTTPLFGHKFSVQASTDKNFTVDDNNGTGISLNAYNNSGSNVELAIKSNIFSVHSATAERFRITNAGNVGIGTTSPNGRLDIKTGSVGFEFYPENTNDTNLILNYDRSTNAYQNLQTRAASHQFLINASEKMRIDSSGNLLVGKTSGSLLANDGIELRSGGEIYATKASSSVLFLNRKTSDGTIIDLRKDNTTVGSIGTGGGDLIVGNGSVGIRFNDSISALVPRTTSDSGSDGAIDIGHSSARFQDIYATNGTIQTSDINEKQDIEELSEAETRVAVAAKGLLKKYRWKSAVADKGDDARIHFGIMAQDLQNAFANEGLDAGDYGMFISSTWTDEATGEEKTRLGVRYNELLAFIIAAI